RILRDGPPVGDLAGRNAGAKGHPAPAHPARESLHPAGRDFHRRLRYDPLPHDGQLRPAESLGHDVGPSDACRIHPLARSADLSVAVTRSNARSQIRAAKWRDIPAVVEIAPSSVEEDADVGFGAVRPESVCTDVSRLSAAWREPNNVRAEEVLVADLQGRIVGCVTVEDRGEVLELINIDVARERQGQGIGTRMVRLIEERARGEGKRDVTLGTSRNAAGVAWKSLPWGL